MLDLTRIQSFVLSAECLSFSEAAKQLHLTQPTISHHIKGLEETFGVRLFDRSSHHLQLTEAGRLLLPLARRLLRQSITIEELMASSQDAVIGQLRIACSTTAGKYLLPLLAARFRQQHAGIQVSILPCTPDILFDRLLGGDVDISVTSSEPPAQGVQSQPFFEDVIRLVVSAEHPWAGRASIEPDALIGEPMVIMGPTSGTRRVLLAQLAMHDITLDDLNVLLELGNAEAIVNTVKAGYGIAFVSALAAAADLELGHVNVVPVSGMTLRRTIYMVRRDISPPNRVQEAFWSFVHDDANADLLQLPKHL